MDNCFELDSLLPNSHHELGEYLYIKLKNIIAENRPIIFLCIGTDRATGDSLGPLIGYKLKNLSQKNIYIYGSLEYPVHSVNLVDILNKIDSSFKNPFIIGIDASLGNVQQIGKIFIEDLPLHLAKEYDGWVDRRVIGFFENYVRTVFTRYKDKVFGFHLSRNSCRCRICSMPNTTRAISSSARETPTIACICWRKAASN